MSAKKQKLRDRTNLTPEGDAISKCAVSATASASQNCASSSSVIDGQCAHGGVSIRSLEQHFIATVQAVLRTLKQPHSQPVPWSVVAVTGASVFSPSIPLHLFTQFSDTCTGIACPSLPACPLSALQPKPMQKLAWRSVVCSKTRRRHVV